MLACLWRHVYGVRLLFWDAKELRYYNLGQMHKFTISILHLIYTQVNQFPCWVHIFKIDLNIM